MLRPLGLGAAIGALAALPIACSGIRVSQDYEPGTDFSRYRSWYWLPPSPGMAPRVDDDLVHARVRAAVEVSLAEKGYGQAEGGEGDFGVGHHAALGGGLDLRTIDHYYGYGRQGPRRPASGGAASETIVSEYEQGTLILDVVDRRRQKLVWRGSIQAHLREGGDSRDRAQRIQDAVSRILAKFPPD